MNLYIPSRIILSLVLLAVVTPFLSMLDMKIAHWFYSNDQLSQYPLWNMIYHYGIWPGWLLFACAIIAYVSSFFKSSWNKWKYPSLYLMLTLIIGSGIITHVLFKDHWGRPRPRQVLEFGGTQPFRSYFTPNLLYQPEPSKSFPCGHSSMGFYFFSLALLGRYLGNPFLKNIGWVMGGVLGGLLGLARMAEGGHFFSDVVLSALILWYTSELLAPLFLKRIIRK